MTSVRFYVATSLDGFIADQEGSVDWLQPYDPRNYGYDTFAGEIGAVVMGRRTYDFVRAIGVWPYAGKRAYVLSSHKMQGMPAGVTSISLGLAATLQLAREATTKDIWIVGGAITMQSALDGGYVDSLEIFIVPILLGSGLPLLSELQQRHSLAGDGIEAFPDGVVKLRYRTIKSR